MEIVRQAYKINIWISPKGMEVLIIYRYQYTGQYTKGSSNTL